MELREAVGTRTPVAKLAVEPVTLGERLGLRFTELGDNLGPVLFAYGQLSDGTIVGFSRLIHDPAPGTDLYQYANRPARDVLAELLHETGLTHDDVTWIASEEGDNRLWARSRAEASLYLLLHQEEDDPTPAPSLVAHRFQVDGVWVVRYRDIEIHIQDPEGVPPLAGIGIYSLPEHPPSTIIDAGEWMFVASKMEGELLRMVTEYGARQLTPDEYWPLVDALAQATGAVDEALRFIPPGEDEVPVRAFWTRLGQAMLRQNPDAFNRRVLEAKAAEYRHGSKEIVRVYGPGPRTRW